MALLLIAQLASCAKPAAPTEDTTAPDSAADTTTAAETEPEPVDTNVYDDLGDIKFDGEEFNLWLTYKELEGMSYGSSELTGEVFEDAMHERNRAVEERLGIKLTYTSSPYEFGGLGYAAGNEFIRNQILSGDDTYDAYQQVQHAGIPGMINDQLFVDWNEVPNVDITKPYWHSRAINDINYGTKIYNLTGFYENSIMSALSCVFFNKNILSDAGVAYPYEAVLNGTWTYDMFMEMTEQLSRDLNGDGKLELATDLYGYVGRTWNSPYAMYMGMGGDILAKDENNTPVDVINTERNIAIMDRILAMMNPEIGCLIIDNTAEMKKHFIDAKAAMIHGELRYAYEDFREMEDDFGFVPPPKYDENQEDYQSWIRSSAPLTYIPITNTHLDFTGAVLEILAMESYNKVTPAYFEKVLTVKVSRDDESATMVPIIRSVATFYDHAVTTPDLVECLQGRVSLVTVYAANKNVVEQLLVDLTKTYASSSNGK